MFYCQSQFINGDTVVSKYHANVNKIFQLYLFNGLNSPLQNEFFIFSKC